jgi:hypothetical protein
MTLNLSSDTEHEVEWRIACSSDSDIPHRPMRTRATLRKGRMGKYRVGGILAGLMLIAGTALPCSEQWAQRDVWSWSCMCWEQEWYISGCVDPAQLCDKIEQCVGTAIFHVELSCDCVII